MVSHEKFIFVHMVKTGGTFLQHYFGQAVPGCKASGSGANRHKPASAVKAHSQYKFGVMRNPYKWYVSWWYFQAVQRSPGNSLPTVLVPDFPQSIKNLEAARGMLKQTKSPLFIDFDILQKFDIGVMTYKFIETFCDSDSIFSAPRFDGFKGSHLLIDSTVPMEELTDALPSLFMAHIFPLSDEQIKTLRDMPRANVSDHKDHKEYYDKPAQEWVAHKERYLFNLYPDYGY